MPIDPSPAPTTLIPPGTIVAFAGNNLPSGWLWCDNTIYNVNKPGQAQYNNLYTAIGTFWGSGDGTSGSFQVPDLRGVFLRGVDGNAGVDPDRDASAPPHELDGLDGKRYRRNNGGNIGNMVGSYQRDQFLAHNHPISPNHAYMDNDGNTNSCKGGDDNPVRYSRQNISTSAAGGSETRPKNAYVNYIIKY
jgi:microcystin-dependent protein